jgi:hypothetical protein
MYSLENLCNRLSSKQLDIACSEKATAGQVKEGNELLVGASLTNNVAPWFLECEAFKAYVKYIAGDEFITASRYTFHQAVRNLSESAEAGIKDLLVQKSSFI